MADQETVSLSTTNITSLTDIGVAFRILQKLKVENLKLKPHLFRQPLFRYTMLHREQVDDEFQGVNEVLRKNVYYMAILTENMSDNVIEQLHASDILNEEEYNQILQQPSTKLRSVKMFAFLVEKDYPERRIFPTVIAILKENNNGKLVGLLENFCDDYEDPENVDGADGTDAGIVRNDDEQPDPDGAQGGLVDADDGRWLCRLCTFSNSPETVKCEMCTLRRGIKTYNEMFTRICPECISINPINTAVCSVCLYSTIWIENVVVPK
ncbi:unnamed protein product [Orchesella dallaii]|uniref:RanBP2-type domain-containing protein n=1 Tax=Orchesella dallaii TaxID=48710 RepID=A0ABP1S672_9HEXA